jgi:hypothetical protein
MFGEVFQCTHCDFGFNSGWSHHERSQSLLCLGCASGFRAHHPETVWGPDSTEPLKLLQGVYRKKKRSHEWQDTGITLKTSETVKPGARAGVFNFLYEALTGFTCPVCAQKNSIVETIAGEPPCPKCKTGQMKYVGECIY